MSRSVWCWLVVAVAASAALLFFQRWTEVEKAPDTKGCRNGEVCSLIVAPQRCYANLDGEYCMGPGAVFRIRVEE